MSMATLENAIVQELRLVTGNPKLRKKDMLEWQIGQSLQAESDKEVAVWLPDLQVTVIISKQQLPNVPKPQPAQGEQ